MRRRADREKVDADHPQAEHAWKALTITNEWVRHADAKIAATLAFVGVTAVMLFNLVHDRMTWSVTTTVLTIAAIVSILIAVCFSVAALSPRTDSPNKHIRDDSTFTEETAINLLFFGDVSRAYASDPLSYRNALASLTSNGRGLTEQIADQVHTNSQIAALKYRRAQWAIRSEVAAVVLVASLAVLEILQG